MKLCVTCQTLYGDEFEYCPRDETQLIAAPKETLAMYDPMKGLLLDGRYRLLVLVGSGTLGDVYSAMFESMEKPVAVKILRAEYAKNPGWSEKFLHLAQLQSQVEHRHLVSVTDFGTTPDGRPFFVMDWISGEHLGEYVHRKGALAPKEAVDITQQIAQVLMAAHYQGLVHQNLKPSNVRLQTDSTAGRKVVVTDLGLFTPAGSSNTVLRRELQLYGNPRFMAPEQVRGMPPSPAMDVYQLGLLMYTLLAGTPPFSGDSFHELAMAQVQSLPPPLPSHIPRHLRDLVFRMLEKNPANRPANMAEVLKFLHTKNQSIFVNKFFLTILIIIVITIFFIIIGFWFLSSSNQQNQDTERKSTTWHSIQPTSNQPPHPSKNTKKQNVRILIDTVPAGARILIGDQVQQAPAWFELPQSDVSVLGRTEMPGRPPLEFQFVPRRSGQVFLHLDSVPRLTVGSMKPVKLQVEPELLDPYEGK